MNDTRDEASAVILNGYICVAGGYTTEYTWSKSVELYNPSLNEWRELKEMNKSRANFGLVELDGYLYAMGGDRIIEKYDPRTDCWAEVCEMIFKSYMRKNPRFNLVNSRSFRSDHSITAMILQMRFKSMDNYME